MDNTTTSEGPPIPDFLWEIHNSQLYFLGLSRAPNSTVCTTDLLRLSRLLYMYGVGLIIAIAVLLNGVMFLVFVSKALRRYACSSYLSSLAVLDFLVLCTYIPRGWADLLVSSLNWGHLDLGYENSVPVCKVVTFMSHFLKFMSAWCLVALGYSRMAAVKDIVRMRDQQSAKSARIIVAYIACLGILLNGHVFFTWSALPHSGSDVITCSPAVNSTKMALFLTVGSVSGSVGVPTLASLTLCVYLMRGLHKEKHFLTRRLSNKVILRLKQGRQISRMVLSLCGAAALLGLPHTVAWVVVVLQHVTRDVISCHYLFSVAARDITEVLFMLIYTCKLFICMMSGMPLLGERSS